MFRTTLIAVAATVALLGTQAAAATLTGTFDVRVVNFNSAGDATGSNADQANFDARFNAATDGVNRDTFTYTGALDFFIDNLNPANGDAETIADFFTVNTTAIGDTQLQVGEVIGLDATVSGLQLSKPTFDITTLFEFTEVYSNTFQTRVTHDDGITLYNNGTALLSRSAPTGIVTSPSAMFQAGEFKLIYAAANGNPSKLLVQGNGIPAVPLPAGAVLLLTGLAGLGLARRRKAAA